MPFALKLFNIQVLHTYYASGISNDLALIPDEATNAFMRYHHMQLLPYDGTYEMLWLTSKLDNPFEVFQEKLADEVLRFYIKLRDPYAINFSALTIQPDTIYAFANSEHTTSLHKNTYVDETDKVTIYQSINSFANPDPFVWGILQIQLGHVWLNHADTLPIPYTLQIKAREVIWRYRIVDLHQRIKSPLKIVIDEDDSYFIDRGLVEDSRIHLYESKQPIALRDTTDQFFSLKMYPKSSTKNSTSTEQVLIKRLPLPNVRSLENNEVKKGIFYSDIVVYV